MTDLAPAATPTPAVPSVLAGRRPATRPWPARSIARALFNDLVVQGWAPFTEVTAPADPTRGGVRRIDMFAVRFHPAAGLERLAIEIKVTRADFRSDVANPAKQQPWRDLCQQHVYATPAGLVDPADVPAGSGLFTVERLPGYPNHPGLVTVAKPAPVNADAAPLPDWLWIHLVHRGAWAEAHRKNLTFTAPPGDLVEGLHP